MRLIEHVRQDIVVGGRHGLEHVLPKDMKVTMVQSRTRGGQQLVVACKLTARLAAQDLADQADKLQQARHEPAFILVPAVKSTQLLVRQDIKSIVLEAKGQDSKQKGKAKQDGRYRV